MPSTVRLLAAAIATATALALCPTRGAAQSAPPAAVTYIGSSGFLIEAGGRRILIDALFDGFPGGYVVPASVQEPLLAGRPPFDRIDLVLVTHNHADHFSAAAVRRALEANPQAVFVGPADAVAALSGVGEARVTALDVPVGERRALQAGGVAITAMRFSHGRPPAGQPGIVNLAYLVGAGGLKFLHTGDVDVNDIPMDYLRSLGVAGERVDVAFVPHFLLSTPVPLEWVRDGLRPRVAVASHLRYTGPATPNAEQIQRNFPGAVVLRTEGERWTVR